MPGDETECPTCGRDDFASERGMKNHHARQHGESLAGVKTECAACGETIRVGPGNYRKTERNYCSDECRYPAKAELDCAECGETFACKQSHADRRKYCSLDCMGAAQTDGEWVTKTCPTCGDTFEKPPSLGRLRYCSQTCYWDDARGIAPPVIKQVRRWLGDRHWPRIAAAVRERDGYECQMCGAAADDVGRELDVHHIVPVRRGGGNTMGNLITLCPPCHIKAEPWSMTFGIDLLSFA